jgi:hypothetical protein
MANPYAPDFPGPERMTASGNWWLLAGVKRRAPPKSWIDNSVPDLATLLRNELTITSECTTVLKYMANFSLSPMKRYSISLIDNHSFLQLLRELSKTNVKPTAIFKYGDLVFITFLQY